MSNQSNKPSYVGDLVFSTGEYEKDGMKKKRYTKAAAVFKYPDGNMTFKFEALPASPDWSGYMSLFLKDGAKQNTQNQSSIKVSDKPIDLSEITF